MRPRVVLVWLMATALAGVFGYAGSLKLRDPAAFATDIENYQLLSSGPSALLAVYLPWLELLLAAGLLLPRWRRSAGLLVIVLMAVFTVAVLAAMARGLNIDCGCFGHDAASLHWALVRDVALLLLALGVFKLSATPAKPHGTD
jgi:putative oxidoreductase